MAEDIEYTIEDALDSPSFFGPYFDDESWFTWRVILKSAFGLSLEQKEFEVFKEISGRSEAQREKCDELWVVSGVRGGKALGVETLIPTTCGYKRMGDLVEGDYVYGSDGFPTRIEKAHPIENDRPCYKISFNDGKEIVADRNHEWFTVDHRERKSKYRAKNPLEGRTRETWEILGSLCARNGKQTNHAIPVVGREGEDNKDIPIDPYFLGLWLGDGNTRSTEVTTGDEEVVDYFKNNHSCSISKKDDHFRVYIKEEREKFIKLNLFGNKHIPERYLFSSKETRLNLLKGLMDSDGYCSKDGKNYFYSINERLSEDFRKLAESLGCVCHKYEKESRLNGKDCGTCHIVSLTSSFYIYGLERKKSRQTLSSRSRYRYITNVEKADSSPVRCITVENEDGLFQIEDGILTHNSRNTALLAVYMACFFDYTPYITVGEVPTIIVLAPTQAQARTVFRYAEGFVRNIPALRNLVKKLKGKELAIYSDTIVFDKPDQARIEIHPNSHKSIQGYSAPIVICDEIAYWKDENSSSPDKEVIDAARPRMASFPQEARMLIGISTPHQQQGVLWSEFRDHFGINQDPNLVFKAPTWILNPTITQKFLDKQYADDPVTADRYYGASFRSGELGFLDNEWVESCINESRPPQLEYESGNKYVAYIDPSGGQNDAMTYCIAHREGNIIVIDAIGGKQGKFSPRQAIKEFAPIIKRYGVKEVHGDRYAGNWVSEEVSDCGLVFRNEKRNKSDIYLEVGPLFAQGAISMPKHETAEQELKQLQRKTNQNNKEVIDHPRRGKDDFANALCGAVLQAHEMGTANFDLGNAMFGDNYETIAS